MGGDAAFTRENGVEADGADDDEEGVDEEVDHDRDVEEGVSVVACKHVRW